MSTHSSIVESLFVHAAIKPEALCIADTSGSLSYGELRATVCGIAEGLIARGVRRGQLIAIRAGQNMEFLACVLGINLAGAVCMPLEKTSSDARILEIFQTIQPAFYIDKKPLGNIAHITASELFCLRGTGESLPLPDKMESSLILFTTGTTGTSKGILLHHAADVAVAQNVQQGVQMGPENIEMIPMPLNHALGLRRCYSNIINGSSSIIVDGMAMLGDFFNLIDRYHATSLAISPAAMSMLMRLAKKQLRALNDKFDYVQLSGSALAERDKQRMKELLPNCRLYNFYGCSEAGCSCVLNFNSAEDSLNCIGRPTVNSSACVLGPDGSPIESSRENPGLLAWKGDMMMDGYYADEEKTNEVIIDGWVGTHDLGYIDPNGLVYMLGRVDDVINSGGLKISPDEVEDAVRRIPSVTECACVSAPDDIMGQIPVLYLEGNPELSDADILREISHTLEPYKIPKKIRRIEILPRTDSGKLLRRKLVELEKTQH